MYTVCTFPKHTVYELLSTVYYYYDYDCAIIMHLTTVITEEPQSVTALVGTVAQFNCTVTGNHLHWVVDGLSLEDSSIKDRGISAETNRVSGGTHSTLTVPATPENNAMSILCGIYFNISVPVLSDNATLTVLPGTRIHFIG